MLPVWLIEAGVYGAEAEPLRAEIRRQGLSGELRSRTRRSRKARM